MQGTALKLKGKISRSRGQVRFDQNWHVQEIGTKRFGHIFK